jgi:hypothetical protein
MNITAVTPAQMIHAAESGDWQRRCQRCARAQMDLYQRVNSSIHPMCVSAPRAGPTHKLPQDIEQSGSFASGEGSQSAPIGTPAIGNFCTVYQRDRVKYHGVPVRC